MKTKNYVRSILQECIDHANSIYPEYDYTEIKIKFTLKGNAIAQLQYSSAFGITFNYKLNCNLYLLSKHPEHTRQTILHELAHYVDSKLNGKSSHGKSFKRICTQFGIADHTKSALGQIHDPRIYKYRYDCQKCGEVIPVSSQIHHKIVEKGGAQCVICSGAVKYRRQRAVPKVFKFNFMRKK